MIFSSQSKTEEHNKLSNIQLGSVFLILAGLCFAAAIYSYTQRNNPIACGVQMAGDVISLIRK
jgi:hypothetical protein